MSESLPGGSGADQVFSFSMQGNNRKERGSVNAVLRQRLKQRNKNEK